MYLPLHPSRDGSSAHWGAAAPDAQAPPAHIVIDIGVINRLRLRFSGTHRLVASTGNGLAPCMALSLSSSRDRSESSLIGGCSRLVV